VAGGRPQANDYNESDVLNQQMTHLGRTLGNPLPAIMQKYLTGHPKGAAAAWMLNGLLQVRPVRATGRDRWGLPPPTCRARRFALSAGRACCRCSTRA